MQLLGIIALLLFSWNIMFAQTKTKITDVDFVLRDDKIIVSYSIVDASANELFNIGLKFVTDQNQVIVPQSLKGDVGKNIQAGFGKTIIWDISKEQTEISGILKAVVTIMSIKITKKVPDSVYYKGPSNAFLSLLFPGLGGFVMEKNKIRSLSFSVTALGLIGYGLIQKNQSDKYYSDYKNTINPGEMDKYFNKANSANHAYILTTRIGAAIWVIDIIWVACEGFSNRNKALRKVRTSAVNRLMLDYTNNFVGLRYRLTF